MQTRKTYLPLIYGIFTVLMIAVVGSTLILGWWPFDWVANWIEAGFLVFAGALLVLGFFIVRRERNS